MFSLQNVTKRYARRGQEVVALRAEHLEIDRGEYVAVVGASGSGKSTLLSLLGGMLAPSEGHVFLDGQSLYALDPAARARVRRGLIGFVFQTFNLVPYLSALDNVRVPLFLAGRPAVDQRDRAFALLERVELADRIDHKPCELSTGQQQRVALARTLANDPPVILADEPTGNLDPQSREMVLSFLDEFHAEGRTIVMVTHDMAAAGRAARSLRLNLGIVEPAPHGALRVA